MRAYITNTSAFLPNRPIENERIEEVLGMVGGMPSRAKRLVLRSNGIKQRYYAVDPSTGEPTYTNAEMTAACVKRLFASEEALDSIDCLAAGTSIPDQVMPGHGLMVHGELGNACCEVVSTSGICLSSMAALKYAAMGVRSEAFATAVSTGSELVSPLLCARNFEAESKFKIERLKKKPEIAFEKDFLRWMLSDGAGAFLLENHPHRRAGQPVVEIAWIEIYSYANELETCMYSGAEKLEDGSLRGWKSYSQQALIDHSVMTVKQDVKLLNENIVSMAVRETLKRVIEKTGLQVGQVDYFLPHISSMYFNEKVYQALVELDFEIPRDRWFTNLTTKGNTGSASIYIMLDELLKSGRLKSGDRLLCFVPESGRFSSSFMLLAVV
ncbi:MAG: beta-ketoacyl-ACP synthase III [Candidatus Thiodiazotropha sp. (ex Epidulcina cf. delphinae)]|nr:beta-ketoacyl-ACP synthase III [Candidatus Thiodiazotropha sp. (ex Epidulcina cf. delphinae)]